MANIDVIFSWIQTIKLVFLYGWPFMLLLWIVALKIKWRNWPIDVVIIEKRGDNFIKSNDRAGKYTDPYTGMVGTKLQKNKDTIPVVNYEWILHNNAKFTTIFDRFINLLRDTMGTVFLFKYGVRQYKPIYVNENNTRKLILKELKNKKGEPILVYLYEQFDPRKSLGSLNFEVIDWDNMNFMVQEQRASFERRQKKKGFMREIVIPLAALAVTAILCIIFIKFSYDYAIAMKGGVPDKPATNPNIPVVSNIIPAG